MLVRTCVHVHLDTLQYTIEWTDFQSTVLARAMGVFHLNSIIHIQTKPDTCDHVHKLVSKFYSGQDRQPMTHRDGSKS